MTTPPEGQRLLLTEWGETPMEALERHIRLEPQPAPVSEVGPHDLLVRVHSCAVGWVDLIMSSGQYQHMAHPPYTPGLEFAGEVQQVGAQVTRFEVGDAVVADPVSTGPRSAGRYQPWGGMATYAIVPESAALELPPGLSFDQAVNLLGNYETAYHALIHRARLTDDESVLVNGASGSTGLAAVDVAKMLGATVIATGRDAGKLAQVARLGADHVLAIDDGDGVRNFSAELKELAGGGVHVVFDGVGGPATEPSLRSLRFGGRYCIVGWASTPFVARGKGRRGAPKANMLPTNLVQMKGLDVLGCPAVIATKHDSTLRPKRLDWIRARVREGRLRPCVGHVFSLEEYVEAFIAKWKSRYVGGCVIHP